MPHTRRQSEEMLHHQMRPLNKKTTMERTVSKNSEGRRYFNHSNFFDFVLENWRFLLCYTIPFLLLILITINSTISLVSIWRSSKVTLENHQVLYQMLTKGHSNQPSIPSSHSTMTIHSPLKVVKNSIVSLDGNNETVPEAIIVMKNKDPLSMLGELTQKGAKFTCDLLCQKPLLVKSYLKVNGESQTWEAISDSNQSAKQEVAFIALKDLYPPYILTELYHKRRNINITGNYSDCLIEPPQLPPTNSTIKVNKKC